MKIITWNCNMAFRKKADLLLAHKPDILVIQECECPEKMISADGMPTPNCILWFGNNQHKGLAVIAFGGIKLRELKVHSQELQMIVPIKVTGGAFDFNLFAIWANNPNDPDGQYVEQVWKAIHHYEGLLSSKKTILTGDFNSNTIWDRKRRAGNHSNIVKYLEEKGIFSAYHLHHQQMQGKEQHPTFYLYRHRDKPYHLDYCFVSKDIAKKVCGVEVGDHTLWCQYSDHVPVIVTIEINK
jgi:exodeoxyribonuclease-3